MGSILSTTKTFGRKGAKRRGVIRRHAESGTRIGKMEPARREAVAEFNDDRRCRTIQEENRTRGIYKGPAQ